MSHFEQRLRGEQKFRGKIIDVVHDTVLLENGKEALREVARHPGAVGILVMDGTDVVLVRQFRYPVGRELLEIPAGKLEKGEDPYPAALRELREETGGATDRLEVLGEYYGSAGFCDEKLTLYFAHLTETGETDPDEDEFLTVERLPLPVFEAMIARGEIVDGKTLSAYTLAKAKGLF